MSKAKQQLISIVVPVYNEAPNLQPFHDELSQTLRELPYDFEILFVDDGSADNSATILYKIARHDPQVHLIQFSRNFGKEAAVSAGLDAAQGNAVIMLDADMQMPPHLIGEFIAKWEEGSEVVVGVFAARSMQFMRRVGAKVFYGIMQIIGNTKITPHATDYRLLDRQVVDTFKELSERNRITRGMIDWLGFERSYVYFEQQPRLHGSPNYSFKQLIELAMNSFTAYSLVPLKMAGYLGAIILSLSVPAGIFMYIERFIMHDPFRWGIRGTAMLAMMLVALVGLVLACLGLMSLYIAHIHTEVIDRPLYVVRRKPKAEHIDLLDEAMDEATEE